MKKRFSLLSVTLLTAGLLVSCGSSSTYGKYVKLGDYKGVAITKIKTEVTDEALQDEIDMTLEDNAEYNEITDRGCQNGDLINIDFTGTIDGEEFDGGSATDYDLELGQGYFLEDLEAGIVGMKTGEEKEITIIFPEEYDEELGGKETVFQVTLNSIYEVILPEYNDEFVASISDFSTTAEFEEDLKQSLYEQTEESNNYMAGYDALAAAVANATFSGYPQELYDKCKESYDEMNAMYAEMFGMDVEDFELSEEETKETVEQMVYEKMVITTIAEKEKLTVSEDEYKDYVNSLYADYGYDSAEDFEADYSKDSIMEELQQSKVQDFLVKNASITEVSEDEYYSEMYGDEEYYEEEELDDEELLEDDPVEIIELDEDLTEEVLDSEEETDAEAAQETETASAAE
ncbi:MAG: trigger factor [Candidatus Limivivens sp.]|nr:trigger factor [Candidatus Limivivens sp.]